MQFARNRTLLKWLKTSIKRQRLSSFEKYSFLRQSYPTHDIVRQFSWKQSNGPTSDLSAARPDSISIRRSALIQNLCDSYLNQHPANKFDKTWPKHFIMACHVLESYMLLHHHKSAKSLMFKFRCIDPDRIDRCVNVNFGSEDTQSKKDDLPVSSLEELSFMTQFAFVLEQAGYREIPEQVVKDCLKKQHKYGDVEVEVNYHDYTFVRFWVYGKKHAKQDTFDADLKKESGVLYERVIVGARNKKSNNMILKGFKDVPEDHFESLLPEAKVQIPRGRRWFLNFSLTSTFLFAFFNIWMTLLTEIKIDFVWVFFCFVGFIAVRSLTMYRNQRKSYILQWKNMLYYKSTANNAGLVMDTINNAHERALKEALLVYGIGLMLTKTETQVTEAEITAASRHWLTVVSGRSEEDFHFSPTRAFGLLQRLGVMTRDKGEGDAFRFQVTPPAQAARQLANEVQAIAVE